MPPIRPEALYEALKDYKKPDDLLSEDGLLQQLTRALVERALTGELTHRLAQRVEASDEVCADLDKTTPSGKPANKDKTNVSPSAV